MRFLNRGRYDFNNTSPGDTVRYGFHAVAIDEHRGAFGPTLWTQDEPGGVPHVEQVWFPGVHSDIGGSYQDDRDLGDLTLDWMIKRVGRETNLDFDLADGEPGRFDTETAQRKALGRLHESRKGVYFFYRFLPFLRVIGGRTKGLSGLRFPFQLQKSKSSPISERVHVAAIDRCKQLPRYRPHNLVSPLDLPQVDYTGTLVTNGS